MTISATLSLTEQLIALPSVTPDDGGCQELLSRRLAAHGFTCESLPFGGVQNLWAYKAGPGSARPLVVFAGHTDVVPPGPRAQWQSDPFVPTIRDGSLFGRGAADMKTSIAAFVVAAEEFVSARPNHGGSIGLLITSDEEGAARDGSARVCEVLKERAQALDYCIVGEPTSVSRLGDMIKNGRRGTLSAHLVIKGMQGHVAYPHLAKNPIHAAAAAVARLVAESWDQGNAFYVPTSLQISNIHAGTGATNVIPGELTIDFNFRFCSSSTPEDLKARVHGILDGGDLEYAIEWTLGGMPYLTPPGRLSAALSTAIMDETGVEAELSTTGGTSDGRFIAQICPEVIEFGPLNASIHKTDEHIPTGMIEPLKNIYRRALELLLADAA